MGPVSLSKYYDQIIKEPLLGVEEERDLFLEYQDEGLPQSRRDAIRDRIIRANLRYVFKEAKKYSKADPDMFQELISAGNEGLLVGMEKYNPNSGFRFLTYAGWWVTQRILKQMASQRLVALPIWRQQLASKIQRLIENREGITVEELLAEFPQVPAKDVRELFETRFLTFYIEDLGDDPGFEIDPIGQQVDTALDQEKVLAAVEKLPSPHKEVIQMSFGLMDGEEHKPIKIAEELGISKERVRTLKKEALSLLNDSFGGVNPFK